MLDTVGHAFSRSSRVNRPEAPSLIEIEDQPQSRTVTREPFERQIRVPVGIACGYHASCGGVDMRGRAAINRIGRPDVAQRCEKSSDLGGRRANRHAPQQSICDGVRLTREVRRRDTKGREHVVVARTRLMKANQDSDHKQGASTNPTSETRRHVDPHLTPGWPPRKDSQCITLFAPHRPRHVPCEAVLLGRRFAIRHHEPTPSPSNTDARRPA